MFQNFDRFLRYRHDMTNTHTCAEGVSSNDEYRVVQYGSPDDTEYSGHIHVSQDGRFHALREFDSYRVFERR
jgi:hypothetical protein